MAREKLNYKELYKKENEVHGTQKGKPTYEVYKKENEVKKEKVAKKMKKKEEMDVRWSARPVPRPERLKNF